MDEYEKHLVEDNIRLAYDWAHKYKNTNIELDDLIQYATIGLIKAAKTFDSSKNFKFSSYASACIMNELNHVSRKAKRHLYKTVSLDVPASTIGLRTSEYLTIAEMLVSDDDVEEDYQNKTDRELNKFAIGLFMYSKSELDKQIVKLRMHETRFPEIAKRLQKTVKTVSLRFLRMRDSIIQLSKQIERDGEKALRKYSSQQLMNAIPTFNYLAKDDHDLIGKITEKEEEANASKAIRGVS